MTIQLLKNGDAVLTAKSDHRRGDSCALLPITYEGDMTLHSRPRSPGETATADMVESIMWRIALQHDLEVVGDHGDIIPKHRIAGF